MFRQSPIGTALKNPQRMVRLSRSIDPRPAEQRQIAAILRADEQQVCEYEESVAANWKERRRIRRAA